MNIGGTYYTALEPVLMLGAWVFLPLAIGAAARIRMKRKGAARRAVGAILVALGAAFYPASFLANSLWQHQALRWYLLVLLMLSPIVLVWMLLEPRGRSGGG